MDKAVDIQNLGKTYKASGRRPETVALRDINLEIPRGSIFGLLGPNGAGKSTIINIMAGLVVKSTGSVTIWGFDIDVNERNAKVSIGVVPQEINYDAFFTPLETLELQAGLFGVAKAQRRSMEILEMVGLADKANAFVRSLSGGMKRRLLVAKAMVHSPPILVLDEPTAGVDIELRQQLWGSVQELNRQGVTILLTTHYLEEAQTLCDRIAIINKGAVVACEETPKLLARIDNKEILFRLDREIKAVPEGLAGYAAEVKNKRVLAVRYSPGEQKVDEMIQKISQAGYRIDDISTEESDLEDVFLQLTSSK
ncbi:MAG: ABC transporter ATP-binding protein [Alphaproteobacteria bacterium]|nr:ABC transporter ATP-binding protein [Alphaproteobacteria bacterium]